MGREETPGATPSSGRPARHVGWTAHRFNRLGTMAAVPLMVLAIAILSRGAFKQADYPRPEEGVLVVANLRGESLSFNDLRAGAGGAQEQTLALAGPPHELAIANGRVYATLGRGNALVEVEPHGNGVLRSQTFEGEPHGLASTGSELLVTLDRANELVHVDLATFAETGREATGDTPHAVAVAGGDAYVANARANSVAHVGSGAPPATTGALPESVAVAGDYVVTANADGRSVQAFRRDTLDLAMSMSVQGRPVRVVTLDARRVLVTLQDAGKLLVIDVSRGRVEKTVPTAAQPDGICISPSGAFVAVASNAADAAQVFRVGGWELVDVVPAGDGPGACAWLPGN